MIEYYFFRFIFLGSIYTMRIERLKISLDINQSLRVIYERRGVCVFNLHFKIDSISNYIYQHYMHTADTYILS